MQDKTENIIRPKKKNPETLSLKHHIYASKLYESNW